ncbi:hypothetical protein WJX82_009413 [Trebouxia sp. C0006]
MQVLGRRSEQSLWQKLWRRLAADQRSKHSSAKTKRAKFDTEESYKTFVRRHQRRRHNEYLKQQAVKGWEDVWETPKGAARSRQADDMAASLPDEQLWLWMTQGSASAKTGRQQRKAWREWTKQFHESESYAHQYQAQQDHSSHTADADTQRKSSRNSTWQQPNFDHSNWGDHETWHHFTGFQQSSSRSWQESFGRSAKSERSGQHSRSDRQQKHNAGRQIFAVQQQRCMQILGLPETAVLDAGVVKTAFLECAKKWHPDRHTDESKLAAEDKFKEAQTAYQHLLTYV